VKISTPLLLVILSLFFLAPSPAGPHRVAHVYDGDTIRLDNGEIVRYLGIDAPEIDHEGGISEFLAHEARRVNADLVMGKRVRLQFDKERTDRHGRTLAYVFLDTGDMVNALLVRKGLAHVLSRRPNLEYRERLLEGQRAAMRERLGIWSRAVEKEEASYLGNSGSFTFHRPGCPFGLQTSRSNRVSFKTRFDALWQGYSPCRRCRP
jgi:micrococcal nuclease